MRIPMSKITMPELPPGLASRGHLLDLLDSAEPGQLVSVVAPAGYGKTVLVAEWSSRPGGLPVAWVAVDAADDAARFRATLLASLAAVPGLAPGIARVGARGSDADFVDDLGAVLDAASPVRLVLDDVHDLAEPALRDLARLVRRRPAGLQLVLVSRRDALLPLPRLRLEGQLRELRADALRFDLAETEALLRACEVVASAEEVAVLHERTDGWVAGLRFAVLALRSTDDPGGFIAHFSGSDRSIADYLTDEVMAGLPAPTRRQLGMGAVCGRLQVGLAEALFGRPDARRVLDDMVRGTGLVYRTDLESYHIHPLFRAYLEADLEGHHPARHHSSHTIAARWWLAADDPVHALRHAERAGDPALLAEALRDSGVRLVAAGRQDPVRRALVSAGSAAVAADARMALLSALVLHLRGAEVDAVAALEQARRVRPADPGPELGALDAAVGLLVDGRPTLQEVPPGPVPPELEVLGVLGRAEARAADEEDQDELRASLAGAAACAHAHDLACLEVRALSRLALLEAAYGDHRAMAAAATSAVRTSAAVGYPSAEWAAEATAVLAYRDLLAGEPVAARSRADDVLAVGQPLPEVADLILRVVRRAADADLGESGPEPLVPVDFSGVVAPAPLLAALASLEHFAVLAQGGDAVASDTAVRLERRIGKVGEILVMDARAHVLAGRFEAAIAALEPLKSGSVPALAAQTEVEAHVLLAGAALHTGDPLGGRSELAAALQLGADLDVVRPFAAMSGPPADLLRSVAPPAVGTGYLRRIAVARSTAGRRGSTCLSDREHDVLALLPSLLSATEIADELTVSVNTVKSHIRSIYSKLGVSSRREAVDGAIQRRLLG
ncbi:LuxR C-terminal-related transcriptional regulator [Pseudonocardia broussonetiae]|uniref:HTH luxR-type domain-containing protein n=1 Tax=Pseudonocardia broussonetiae TaxID=2736640 RepID=A0A6M6JSG8_9PSEU|nr:LuxR C-terminal-related transcriptional regulator [Pseudonocardia broussonetiae]QJY49181.1 hypothetical protein HOP40_28340 [Pseudonocardia broussonetiae]